jgi:hypothetical protein
MGAQLSGCGRVHIQPLPVQLPEEERLAQVMYGDRVGALEVGDGARDTQDPAAGARREVEALRGELEQVAAFRDRGRLYLRAGLAALVLARSLGLRGPICTGIQVRISVGFA